MLPPGDRKALSLSGDRSGAVPCLPPQALPSHTGSKDHCPDFLSTHTSNSSLKRCGAFEKCWDKIPEAMSNPTKWMSFLELNPKPLKLWMKDKNPIFSGSQIFRISIETWSVQRVFALCLETSRLALLTHGSRPWSLTLPLTAFPEIWIPLTSLCSFGGS